MPRVLIVLVSLLFIALSVCARAEDGAPLTIAGARQYDIVSRINGQIYRLMVGLPEKTDPAVTYPVFYVLDGNENFGTAIAMARRLHGCCEVPPAIVVGIGYPTDDRGELSRRRAFDLTLSLSAMADDVEYGGADAFLRVLEEELKPFVAAHHRVNPHKQIIFGHSFAGLTALHAMFRNPNAFAVYNLSSPSIWWNGRDVLRDEAAFSERVREGGVRAGLLITVAGDESPGRIAAASDLADRLAVLNPQNLDVVKWIFDGEIHGSVVSASVTRALRFSLPHP